jgi:hypothetical protein
VTEMNEKQAEEMLELLSRIVGKLENIQMYSEYLYNVKKRS